MVENELSEVGDILGKKKKKICLILVWVKKTIAILSMDVHGVIGEGHLYSDKDR